MLKLVLLSEGMTGRTHELSAQKTTIGRLDDNTIAIPEASVSSHHCEITMRGRDVMVKDLNSTNGTFINGERVTECLLKPGEVLRLGQVAMRLETGVSAPSRAPLDRTVQIDIGVRQRDLDQSGAAGTFHPRGTGFARRSNTGNQIFIVIAIAIGVVIGAVAVYVIYNAGK
jgi:predicted component of type VI protein secretion system